jgi:hypothetical protein
VSALHDLVEAASRALSSNDANALEALAAAAERRRNDITSTFDLKQLRRAAAVLAAQVRATELYLDLRLRSNRESFGTGRANPWHL